MLLLVHRAVHKNIILLTSARSLPASRAPCCKVTIIGVRGLPQLQWSSGEPQCRQVVAARPRKTSTYLAPRGLWVSRRRRRLRLHRLLVSYRRRRLRHHFCARPRLRCCGQRHHRCHHHRLRRRRHSLCLRDLRPLLLCCVARCKRELRHRLGITVHAGGKSIAQRALALVCAPTEAMPSA